MVNDLFTLQLQSANASNTTGDRYGVLPAFFNGGSSNAKWELVAVELVPSATVTADGTNYRTYTVYGKDGSNAQASRNTDSGGTGTTITAGTAEALTVTGGSNAIFLPGDEIKITSGGSGTEPADDNLWICIFQLKR